MLTYLGNVKPYNILATEHASMRMNQRRIDWNLAISAILSIGKTKLEYYENEARDVLVKDVKNDFSIVFYIGRNEKRRSRKEIRIVTVISGIDCHTKENEIEHWLV